MKTILVIEDETQTRNLFLNCLKSEGFYTISAENGVVGIQRAREDSPDLILCNVFMSEVDGYSVLSRLRQDPVTTIIPFIFLTSKLTKAEIRKGMNLGADDYLSKPCTVEELLEAIAAQLKKRAALKKWYTTESQEVLESQSVDTVEPTNSQSFFPTLTSPQLKEVFNFIEANYHQSIGLSDVAQEIGYSAAYLTDLMRRQTGQPLHRWIIKRRLAAACSLLLETDQSIEQIAEAVGYNYVGCFFRQFRQSFDTTPQAWRKAQRL